MMISSGAIGSDCCTRLVWAVICGEGDVVVEKGGGGGGGKAVVSCRSFRQ